MTTLRSIFARDATVALFTLMVRDLVVEWWDKRKSPQESEEDQKKNGDEKDSLYLVREHEGRWVPFILWGNKDPMDDWEGFCEAYGLMAVVLTPSQVYTQVMKLGIPVTYSTQEAATGAALEAANARFDWGD